MTDYAATLRAKSAPSEVAARVRRVRQLYEKYKPWIDRYRGGLPAGFAAAIMQWESDGNMGSVGDAGLGEVGLYQITSSFPPKIGLPADSRREPETNVFLGLIEYQMAAAQMHLAQPLVELGSADAWKLARLTFAVGAGGTKALMAAAAPTTRGKVFAAIRDFVDRSGGMPLGSQSAGLVWYRVHAIDLQWDAGQQAVGGGWGPPTLVPSPPKYRYTLPPNLVPFFREPSVMSGLLLVGLALGVYLLTRH